MDDYWAGKTDGGDILHHITEWAHVTWGDPEDEQVPVHEYLGMTCEEFARWRVTRRLPERGAP